MTLLFYLPRYTFLCHFRSVDRHYYDRPTRNEVEGPASGTTSTARFFELRGDRRRTRHRDTGAAMTPFHRHDRRPPKILRASTRA